MFFVFSPSLCVISLKSIETIKIDKFPILI